MPCDSVHSAAQAACQAAVEKKGEDVLLLDLSKLNTIADYFVIITSRSRPHAKAICQAVEDALLPLGMTRKGREGYPDSPWILLDYRGLVVHILEKEERDYYHLEKLWSQAGCETIREENEAHAKS